MPLPPKDATGAEIKAGDVVKLEFVVGSISEDGTSISIHASNWNWISCPPSQVTKINTVLPNG